jgi:hypothetical protein
VRRIYASLLLTLGIALAPPAVADEALCGEEFASHEALETVIKAKPGVKILPSDDAVVSYSDPATNYIWNFATNSNAAFPSVACRRIVEVDGAFQVATEISCAAAKEACDGLAASYNEFDRKMREAVEKENKR